MKPAIVDRDTFLQGLRTSKLLTSQQLRAVVEKLGHIQETKVLAKALVAWEYLTKFQARMLLRGRTGGFFLGPYRILDQIGHGGMGRVYKAMHQTMHRVVALKVLAPIIVSNERAHELFLREVQAAAQLNHPNIVMAYDASQADGRHYLAMEYVDGLNLEQYVKRHGPPSVGLACEMIFQTATGLQHAHEKGMVHRDIKPANMLVAHDKANNTIHVKILDFGLARLQIPGMTTPADKSIAVKPNTVMGTPDFLSPEQSRDQRVLDIRSDLYSLGCTFYYLLTGQVPFAGGTTIDKLNRHNMGIAQPIEELRPDIPAKVGSIVRKLMAKMPEDRYQTPDQLMDALAPYASPTATDWPVAVPQLNLMDRSDEQVMPEVQGDTEPRAQSKTQVSDEESILEWAGEQSRRRRLVRQVILWSIGIGAVIVAVASAAIAAWSFNG